MHQHGREWVHDKKDFTGFVHFLDGLTVFRNTNSSYLDSNKRFSKGGVPKDGNNFWNTSWICADTDWATFTSDTDESIKHRLLELRSGVVSTSGLTFYELAAYNNTANATDFAVIGVYNDHGTAWAVAPTPSSVTEDSNKIATTAWVRDATGQFESFARGLNRRTTKTDYEMTPSDFSGASISSHHFDFKANTTSAPTYNDGDYEVIRFYSGSENYAQFLCASPRRSALYFGRFWNGTWDGWSQIFNDRSHIYLREGANSIFRGKETDGVYVCGGTSVESSAYLVVNGKSRSTDPGCFYLNARIDNTRKIFSGTPSGTLSWNGQQIQYTSDERLKTPLSNVPDSILDAWGDVEWGQFQYLEAVKEKGENARLHLGMIAQRVKKAFEDKGLDACEYGILCHEERPEVNEETKIVDCKEYTDENGMFHPEESHIETHHEDAVDLWMVRYSEAQAMEAAYQRRRADRAEARIKTLEEKLSLIESKLTEKNLI